ncbi:MAG: cellulase family glycosylhydrolase [Spirochaetales bacterium]|nr:cellulase family glycosylhydrolase [Spirochaetales bacterium]
MKTNFIQVSGKDFTLNNKKIILRGFGVGTWMNIEHFMIGIPGTEGMIRRLFAEVYGRENEQIFFDLFLSSFLTEDDFRLLQKLGINVLRLAINYHHFINDLKPGEFNNHGFIQIDRVLDLCKKYGIFAILDIHAVPGGQNPDWHADNELGVSLFWDHVCFQETIVQLWSTIAEHYTGNPAIAGYDIINEPCFVPDKVIFNKFYTDIINTIRAHDKDHIIFLEGDDWSKDFSLFDPIDDPNTAFTFHLYPDHILQSLNPGKWAKDALQKSIDPFLELREKTNKPLWCGETGNRLTKKHIEKQTAVLKQMLDIYEEHEISWTVWSYKDAGTMSLLYPKEQTPWPGFISGFRKEWDLDKEISMAETTLTELEKQYFQKINKELRHRLQFRLRGIFHNIYCEQLVKPKLKEIPWNEMKYYPLSFLHKNCHMWEEIAQLITSYTIKK